MRRGVEAVFQLLIGVFTAILVITIAYRVLGSVQMNRCHEKWQTSTVQLAGALADAARSSGASDFVQLTGKCGRAAYATYRLVENKSDNICNRVCHRPVSTCYVVRFDAYTIERGKTTRLDFGFYCADISPYTYYQLSNSIDESCEGSSTGGGLAYDNVTTALINDNGGLEVNVPILNAYVRSVGYGDSKKVYVCAQEVG